MRTVLAAAALSIAFVAPAPALADLPGRYAGERYAPAIVQSAVQVGVRIQTAEGHRPCKPILAVVAPSLYDPADGVDAGARAQQSTCTIWVRAEWLADIERELRPRHGGTSLEALCTSVAHEVGHLAGLAHTERGLMAIGHKATPPACQRWAARRGTLRTLLRTQGPLKGVRR